MSEKRFTDIWCSETGHIGVTDYGIDKEFTSDEFEDLLNEQQAIIRRDETSIKTMMSNMEKLEEENEKLKKRINLISDELYCKDRKLEELGIPIECCDKDE